MGMIMLKVLSGLISTILIIPLKNFTYPSFQLEPQLISISSGTLNG